MQDILKAKPNSLLNIYKIVIAINLRDHLISRHWIITDSNAKIQEVFGDGVIGKQPELNSGDQFCYTSGVVIETPVGSMEGKYFMESINGNFEASIPPFTLAIPEILN